MVTTFAVRLLRWSGLRARGLRGEVRGAGLLLGGEEEMKERSHHSLQQPEGKYQTAESACSQWCHVIQQKATGTIGSWLVLAGQAAMFCQGGRSPFLETISLSEAKP